MEFRPGRWESADGSWWVSIDEVPGQLSAYLPPRAEGAVCAEITGDPLVIEGAGIRRQPGDVSQIGLPGVTGYSFHNVLYLRSTGDWSVITDFPCGLEADSLDLIYVNR